MLVLRGQQTMKPVCQTLPQCQHLRAFQLKRSSAAEVHNPHKARRDRLCPCFRREGIPQFALRARRQRMKQRDMRPQVIALRREMSLTELVGARLHRFGQLGRNN